MHFDSARISVPSCLAQFGVRGALPNLDPLLSNLMQFGLSFGVISRRLGVVAAIGMVGMKFGLSPGELFLCVVIA